MRPAWDQTIGPRVGSQRHGPHVLHRLSVTGKGEQLQPLLRDVLLMSKGKVFHHVRPGNGLLEQEK